MQKPQNRKNRENRNSKIFGMDRQTNRPTDTARCTVACPRLKKVRKNSFLGSGPEGVDDQCSGSNLKRVSVSDSEVLCLAVGQAGFADSL